MIGLLRVWWGPVLMLAGLLAVLCEVSHFVRGVVCGLAAMMIVVLWRHVHGHELAAVDGRAGN